MLISSDTVFSDKTNNNNNKNDICCLVTFFSFFMLTATSIPFLIYFLDYYPYTTLELKSGYCKNNKITSFMDSSYIFYNSEIYDEINGTFIGNSNGCTGISINSYNLPALGFNSFDRLPYDSVDGNIPTWLCSFEDKTSKVWDILNDISYENINEYIFNDEWIKCQYSSLDYIKQSPWNIEYVARSGNYDYMSVINIYNSEYYNIKETTHCEAAFVFMFVIPLLFIITILSCFYCGNINEDNEKTEKFDEYF